MIFKRSKNTLNKISTENMLLRGGVGASLLLNMILGYGLATKQETVVLLPPFFHDQMEFTEGKANQVYYEQWAWSVSMLIGNVSPANIAFIKGELERLATPALYRDLQKMIAQEYNALEVDNASITFSPASIIFDPQLGMFFVTGVQSLHGPGSTKAIQTQQFTYEMKFTTQRLRLYLTELRGYQGEPLTSDIRNSTIAAQKAQSEQEFGQ